MDQQAAAQMARHMLLPHTTMPESEVKTRLHQALSVAYWESLCPQLACTGNGGWDGAESTALDAQQQSQLLTQLAQEGYFQTTAPLIPGALTAQMCDCVETLRREGWSPFFSFVYDAFWQVVRTPALQQFLTQALGAGYHQVSHVITHYVKPGTGAGAEAGWRPHIDFGSEPDRLTVWVALNAATLDNGCMYVIPKNRVPQPLLAHFIQAEPVNHWDLQTLLHGSRALPVPAGSVLGWQHDVIHWGSQARPGVAPRISLSMVFLMAQGTPSKVDLPLLEAQTLPTFEQRLYAIGKGMQYYRRHHPLLLGRYSDLAKRLIDTFTLSPACR